MVVEWVPEEGINETIHSLVRGYCKGTESKVFITGTCSKSQCAIYAPALCKRVRESLCIFILVYEIGSLLACPGSKCAKKERGGGVLQQQPEVG